MSYLNTALVVGWFFVSACGGASAQMGGQADAPGEAPRGVITVRNPTPDTWDLSLGGRARGSLAPGSEAQLLDVARGKHVLVAENSQLGLRQDATVEVREVGATVVLEPMVARLRVKNPHGVGIVLVVEGTDIGLVAGNSEAVFDGVPAGKRTLILRSTQGPGAIRVARTLPPGTEVTLVVPELDASMIDPNAPKPPAGMGLILFKNAGQLAVTLVADGKAEANVEPGARFELVLRPGLHKLQVRMSGIEAHTEHTVTLDPNQVAEWVWGAP